MIHVVFYSSLFLQQIIPGITVTYSGFDCTVVNIEDLSGHEVPQTRRRVPFSVFVTDKFSLSGGILVEL